MKIAGLVIARETQASDGAGAKEWREGDGDDEVAFRTERIERRICRAVAEFSFRLAAESGAKVFGGPKYTVSPDLRGDAQGGDGRSRRAAPGRRLRAAAIDATFALPSPPAGSRS